MKVTDLAGALNFFIVALVGLLWPASYFPRQIVLSGLVMVWSLRLGTFLLVRVLRRGKDERFDEMRQHFWKFAGFWVFQVAWVWTVSLPVTFVNGTGQDRPLDAVDYTGWSLWVQIRKHFTLYL